MTELRAYFPFFIFMGHLSIIIYVKRVKIAPFWPCVDVIRAVLPTKCTYIFIIYIHNMDIDMGGFGIDRTWLGLIYIYIYVYNRRMYPRGNWQWDRMGPNGTDCFRSQRSTNTHKLLRGTREATRRITSSSLIRGFGSDGFRFLYVTVLFG